MRPTYVLVTWCSFNTWNTFRCDINDTLVRQVADALVSSGLAAAGYRYVVIDDCWAHSRGSSGRIMPFRDKFPHGMKVNHTSWG